MDGQTSTVILARVSSKSQEDEGYSLDSQLKLLTGYCENKGLTVDKIFKIAETASKEQSRKIFHELFRYLYDNNIYHLTVEKTDRFTRNFRDAVAIDDWLAEDENRRLHAVKENLLLHKNAKSDVKFMWNIHLSVAKKYTDNLREEAMKGWAEKLAQGWLPATPPPGYHTVLDAGKRIHVPNPDTASLMLQIFRKYLNPGESIESITAEMELVGIRTRKGRPYNKSRVQRILCNPFYIGTNHFNGKNYPGAQQPIIPKKLFDRVQAKLHGGRSGTYVKHYCTFKGVIRCSDCGTIVTWQLQKGRYYGACRRDTDACRAAKLLREDVVEDSIVTMLQKLVCPTPEIIDWVSEAMRSHHKESIENSERLAASVQAQIDRVKRMEDTLYDDKLAGEITKGKYEEKHEQLITERQQLDEQLSSIVSTQSQQLEQKLVLLELSQKAADIYRDKTSEQKRLILSKLFAELTLKGGILSVTFTNFARAIAESVQETRKLMEAQK